MKIGFFITARLKSSRLKQKILLDLNGRTILDNVIERCISVLDVENVVLCTSTNEQDSILNNFSLKHKIRFYTGSEDDVLDRLLNAAKKYSFDAFLSITADNPLHSVEIAQQLIKFHQTHNFDFIFTKGLPVGIAPYFLSTKALEVAHFMKKVNDTEIWGPFVNRPDFFRIGELIVLNSPFREEKRLTCDNAEDYELLQNLLSDFDTGYNPTLPEIINVLQLKPEIWKINKMISQKGIDKSILNSIINNFNSQKEKGKRYAISIGKELKPSLKKMEIEI